jgi:hypothetical protein
MATGLRRCYSGGWMQRFYLPPIIVIGGVVGSGLVILGVVGVAVGATGAGLYIDFVGAILLAAALGSWRARRIGIWTSAQELVIRSLARTTRLPRARVADVRCEPRGAHRLGRSNCPVVYTDSESFVVRDLADASPFRWGGDTAAEICQAVRTDLFS